MSVSVSDEKWARGKAIVNDLLSPFYERVSNEPVFFDFKEMERGRGFLVHLSMTFLT